MRAWVRLRHSNNMKVSREEKESSKGDLEGVTIRQREAQKAKRRDCIT